ncbi:MAG: DMT family transporter [Proteobacteria bacterium]|nr:DMT family transporter [Pseudomonadota bacterium]
MICAGLLLTVMITLVKTTRTELGTIEVVFWRGLISVPFTYLFAWRAGLRVHNVRLLVLRFALGFAAVVCLFTAAKGLWIADLSLLSQLQPLMIGFLAPLALGAEERPGRTVWILLVIGLIGCALIVAPDLAVGSIYGLLALIGAFLSAGAHVCLRGLARTDDARTVVFYFHAMLAGACFVIMAVDAGGVPELPPLRLVPHLVGIGVTATLGQLLITRAYVEDRASVVAAARYASPVWAVIIDLIAFGVVPGLYVVVGGILIVGAGMWLIFLPAGPGHVGTQNE